MGGADARGTDDEGLVFFLSFSFVGGKRENSSEVAPLGGMRQGLFSATGSLGIRTNFPLFSGLILGGKRRFLTGTSPVVTRR